MKKLFTLLLATFMCVILNAQDAQVYLTFEDGKIISDGLTGVDNVNGSGDVTIKNDGTYPQDVNAITSDGGESVLFLDYHGYLKFDNTIFNKDAFTITADYKWSGNNVWWLGLHTIVGYDADAETPGYVARQLQLKQPNGIIDGWGLATSAIFIKEEYHHMAITYNSGTITMYIDGVEVSSATDEGIHNLQDPELYFGIKMGVNSATGIVSPSLDGVNCKSVQLNVDNVALFDSALSNVEVAAIANGTSIPTDVEKVDKQEIKVYPNPFRDRINISGTDIVAVEVFNLAGVKVYASKVNNGVVNLESLSNGVYLVNCLNDALEVVQSNKLIKK